MSIKVTGVILHFEPSIEDPAHLIRFILPYKGGMARVYSADFPIRIVMKILRFFIARRVNKFPESGQF
jgi:hypothetical protein